MRRIGNGLCAQMVHGSQLGLLYGVLNGRWVPRLLLRLVIVSCRRSNMGIIRNGRMAMWIVTTTCHCLTLMGHHHMHHDSCLTTAASIYASETSQKIIRMTWEGVPDRWMSQNKKEISNKWEITDQGEHPWIIVRIQILCNWAHHWIMIHQGAYIQWILECFGMANSDTVATPMDNTVKLTAAMNNNLFEHHTLYHEAIGALLYASMGTRPNITFTVQTLSQFASKPSKEHWQAIKRVLRYL